MKLSIVIRCRNEATSLGIVFQALKAQRTSFEWEIVVVDNASDDNTLDLCSEYKARVVSISKNEFTYGRAINIGIQESRGELILLLSSHALPVGSFFLENAVAPFADPVIAAARCLMIGNSDQIAAWFKPRDIQYSSSEEQQKVESGTSWLGDYPTAGCCVLRRSVWEKVPFDEQIEANEDKVWASQVLSQGYSVRCCTESVWLYLRKRSRAAERSKRMREHIALYRINGQPPMNLRTFVFLSLRACLVAPWVAIRHIVENVLWYSTLVSIPWRAKKRPQSGSVCEFNARR